MSYLRLLYIIGCAIFLTLIAIILIVPAMIAFALVCTYEAHISMKQARARPDQSPHEVTK